MAWPTVTIVTTDMDAGTDSAGDARAQIKQMADNANAIKDAKGAASGIAELDAGSLVPIAQVPVVTAVKGGTGQTSFTVGDIFYANTTTTLAKLAAGALGTVLTCNGAGVAPSYQASAGGLVSGTRMLFQQTAAPTGWTKETGATYNNVSLRIVTGTVSSGGTHDFTSVFSASKSSDAFTLTTSHIPPHTHPVYNDSAVNGSAIALQDKLEGTISPNVTGSTGGGGSHSHTIANFDLKYRDFIIATKD